MCSMKVTGTCALYCISFPDIVRSLGLTHLHPLLLAFDVQFPVWLASG